MTLHPPQQPMTGHEATVLGRDDEIERILRCVAREPGTPQTLLLLGGEGTGRTTVLRHVRKRAAADGVLVLSAQGWAEDPGHAHACLRQLLTPQVRGELTALPAAQQRALTALPGADDGDRAELHAAVTALLDRLAATRPVLVCVDDADQCDRAFLEALLTAARLLPGRPLTVLLAARHEADLPGSPPGSETLRLGPLGDAPAAALLDRQPTAPTGRRRLEILAEAEGNPLALVELSRGVPGPTGATRHPLTEHVFGVRLDALPARTRRALLYAAAAGPGETVGAVMAALGTGDLAVWAPAEAAALVALVEDRLDFRHPLARSAAYLRRPAKERQQAHRDLAKIAVLPEARARHLAATTVGPNAFVAALLGDSAWRRGDAVAATTALEQAARLSPQQPVRARRLAEALTAAHMAGDPGWVRELYGRLLQESADPEHVCAAAGALASVLSQESAQREAFEVLADAAEHFPVIDRTHALALAGLAAAIADQSGLPEHTAALSTLLDRARRAHGSGRWHPAAAGPLVRLDTPHTRRALEALVTAVARPESATGSHSGLGRPESAPHTALPTGSYASPGGSDAAQPTGPGTPPDAPDTSPATPDAPAARVVLAVVARHADEADVDLGQSRTADDRLRSARAFGLRGWSVLPLVDTLLAIGRFPEAETVIQDALAEAEVLRLPRLQADLEAQALTVQALRGTLTEAPRLTPAVWRAVCLDENRATHARLLRARGLAALALGDVEGSWRQLRELFTTDGTPLHPHLSARSIAELAVAAQRTGRSAEVLPILERVRAEQGERPSTRMTLLLHHAAAMVGPDDEADEHFQLALVNHAAGRWPWERGQVRFDYAIRLRRRRRTLEARRQLTTVLETAERLGAGALAAAARIELRASGAAPDPKSPGPLEELTAQQRQIVQFAASGLSNREIGERLFLSPRTVGSHLYNVYPKLGISSRHQLRDLVQDR
ncbi:helix-turn-helix transcriptional regulator [Streptomyces tauricus]|uniref:helix-turn-helix transcriptional regulator n=1 Tax=Streptomyces tauricus TaxID=68274 RepID=UPI002244F4C1|nr:LuxR family transcriptional regulator [Streptomyces tauricus]MCW8102970.1 AAA family ATPase [Streptomyces tauricus]